jgi:NADH-ubiquinone oxidoreductase chain 6
MFLNVFTESLTNGYKVELLSLLSLVCIFLGISIIITKNPILSVLFLIALFFSISLYLMLIGLYFIGLSYLLVYVGAISILFLFILMLINVRISELLTEGKNSIPLAIIAVLAFNFSVNRALPYSISVFDVISNNIVSINRFILGKFFSDETISVNNSVLAPNYTVDWVSPSLSSVANVKSKSWDTLLVENTHITSIGNILYTSLFILLIVTSLILLLAMVGTIVITIKKSKKNA